VCPLLEDVSNVMNNMKGSDC